MGYILNSDNSIKPTRLLYASNLSPQMFKEYVKELKEKTFITETKNKKDRKSYSLTEKGFEFLEKYKVILGFIENFGL